MGRRGVSSERRRSSCCSCLLSAIFSFFFQNDKSTACNNYHIHNWWQLSQLGTGQATSNYLNQWWLDYRHIYALLGLNVLTHWVRVTHICVGKLIIIGSDNGLSPDRRQAIIWTNAALLSIGPLRTYFSENLIKIQQFSLKKLHVKISSAK